MSTINATNIVADALVGNTSANAITVRGEGSATTSLQQGLCKAWSNYNQSTSNEAIADSFNVASISDDAEGFHTVNFTSAMSNTNYSVSVYFRRNSNSNTGGGNLTSNSTDSKTASAMKFKTIYIDTNAQNVTDYAENSHHFMGDLA